MTRDVLYRYFEQHYLPKRDMLPRIPLGTDPDEFWQEIQGRRRSRAQMLPLHGSGGIPYWYVTTDRMIAALNSDPSASPEQILDNVQNAVDQFVQEAEQFDDLTMLCIEYKGGSN